MKTKSWTDQQLRDSIRDSFSIKQSLERLGLRPAGGNYAIIKWWIKELKIDTSHFTGQGHLKGKNHNWAKRRSLESVMVKSSNYQSFKLKARLIKANILKEECSSCQAKVWKSRTTGFEEKKIPLELEHKNGDKFDNRLENLELLCPICHAFTLTYRGKNKPRKDRPIFVEQ